jgi:hypothetical protein
MLQDPIPMAEAARAKSYFVCNILIFLWHNDWRDEPVRALSPCHGCHPTSPRFLPVASPGYGSQHNKKRSPIGNLTLCSADGACLCRQHRNICLVHCAPISPLPPYYLGGVHVSPSHSLMTYMEELLSTSRPSVTLSPEGSGLYLPATFGHKMLSEDFASPQEVLIAESGGHERYADGHAVRSDKRRYIDDRHMKSL